MLNWAEETLKDTENEKRSQVGYGASGVISKSCINFRAKRAGKIRALTRINSGVSRFFEDKQGVNCVFHACLRRVRRRLDSGWIAVARCASGFVNIFV